MQRSRSAPGASAPRVRRARRRLSVLLCGALLSAAPSSAQSVLERPPNLHGTWTGRSGTVYFNFLHRFNESGAPLHKVVNFPTFLLGASLPHDVLVGARYATNSLLVAGIPNEWEFFGRATPLRQSAGAPLDVSVHAAFNEASRSVDGELALGRAFGALRLLAVGRAFSNAFDAGEARYALGGGATVRLTDHVALAGDYARLLDLDEAEGEPAWSAGLQLAIPYTPHTLSLQVSNTTTTTLEGASIGTTTKRWGFEFTVPFTLARYFGGGEASAAAGGAASDSVVEVGMTNRLEFTPDTVRIRAGETVRWRNTSSLLHTVTADPSKAMDASSVRLPQGARPFDSGNLEPGATYEHTFTVPGEYRYFCIPHEAAGMIGTVIVTGAGER